MHSNNRNNSRHARPQQRVKTYDIHPISLKLLRAGHFWVTNDRYSEKFLPKEKFIVASDRGREFALLIHDPTHKQVRARVWARNGNFTQLMKNFKNDLQSRIRKAVKLREAKNIIDSRNHMYLVFGESDEIPGLFIKYFDGEILIEFYMDFWKQYQDFIIQNTVKVVNEVFKKDITASNVWTQFRSNALSLATCIDPNATFRRVDISEFGVKYKVLIGKHYDCGLYTDMAAIRYKLRHEISRAGSLLNLYSYTGAFSLYALKLGVKEVTSVDLSTPYLDWLDENIALNEDIDKAAHTRLNIPTTQALSDLRNEKKSFDFIISDPPSSSNDGNKRTNALADYSKSLPNMEKVLSEHGSMLLFLNTHKCTHEKFKNKIKKIIQDENLNLKLQTTYFLNEDCPSKKGFPEGSYLKGLLLKRNDKSK